MCLSVQQTERNANCVLIVIWLFKHRTKSVSLYYWHTLIKLYVLLVYLLEMVIYIFSDFSWNNLEWIFPHPSLYRLKHHMEFSFEENNSRFLSYQTCARYCHKQYANRVLNVAYHSLWQLGFVNYKWFSLKTVFLKHLCALGSPERLLQTLADYCFDAVGWGWSPRTGIF